MYICEGKHFYLQAATPSDKGKGSNGGGREALPYSSLRLQELVKLRLAVEKGNLVAMKELIDSNPRYLIASGDTPSILQVSHL